MFLQVSTLRRKEFMLGQVSLRNVFASVLTCFVLVTPAAAVAPQVKDEGRFFSPETIKKADEQILLIAQKHARDVAVETLPSIPADKAEKFKGLSGEEKAQFFLNWAKERARAQAVNGVYILVTKEPSHLEVVLRQAEKEQPLLSKTQQNKLIELLLKNFRAKRYDEGLLEAIKFVEDQYQPVPTAP